MNTILSMILYFKSKVKGWGNVHIVSWISLICCDRTESEVKAIWQTLQKQSKSSLNSSSGPSLTGSLSSSSLFSELLLSPISLILSCFQCSKCSNQYSLNFLVGGSVFNKVDMVCKMSNHVHLHSCPAEPLATCTSLNWNNLSCGVIKNLFSISWRWLCSLANISEAKFWNKMMNERFLGFKWLSAIVAGYLRHNNIGSVGFTEVIKVF